MGHTTKDRDLVPQIGEIYLMDFSGAGSEQSGVRPGLVFQNNVGNLHSPNVIALPLTSSVKKIKQPTHVIIYAKDTALHMDSIVLCENPERMSKSRIGKYITKLSDDYMRKITEAYLLSTSAIAFLDVNSLLKVHRAAAKLMQIRKGEDNIHV